MKKLKKNDNGAVIVEATIALPIFIFVVFTLMWVANLCTAQAKIQIAINSTAKEISSYTYLYGLTGLHDKKSSMYQEGQQAQGNIDDTVDGIANIYNEFSGYTTDKKKINVDNVKSSYNSIVDSKEQIEDVINEIKKDPAAFFISLGKATGVAAADTAVSYVMIPITKYFCEKHLGGDNANAYLKHLGVVDGLDGVNFKESTYCAEDSDNINIVAIYKLRVIQFFKIDVTYQIVQTATSHCWFPDSKINGNDNADTNTDTENKN